MNDILVMILAAIWWVIFIGAGIVGMVVAFASACGEAAGEESIYPGPEDTPYI